MVEAQPAKVMACTQRFAMVLRLPGSPEFMIVQGRLSNRMLAMECQTANVVAMTLGQIGQMSDTVRLQVEAMFPARAQVATADLHASNTAAERTLADQLERMGSHWFSVFSGARSTVPTLPT